GAADSVDDATTAAAASHGRALLDVRLVSSAALQPLSRGKTAIGVPIDGAWSWRCASPRRAGARPLDLRAQRVLGAAIARREVEGDDAGRAEPARDQAGLARRQVVLAQ